MNGRKALCICASGMTESGKEGTARCICKMAAEAFRKKKICAEILDLQEIPLIPCRGCGRCGESRRCEEDESFGRLYGKITEADYLFFVSPYHAPVPAKICILLEKMLQVSARGRKPEASGQPAFCGKLAGIISYGGGGERMLMRYKAMVNDVIADALEASRLKVVPFNSQWNTGLSFPVTEAEGIREKMFPVKEFQWGQAEEKVEMYVKIMVQTSRTLYAIL